MLLAVVIRWVIFVEPLSNFRYCTSRVSTKYTRYTPCILLYEQWKRRSEADCYSDTVCSDGGERIRRLSPACDSKTRSRCLLSSSQRTLGVCRLEHNLLELYFSPPSTNHESPQVSRSRTYIRPPSSLLTLFKSHHLTLPQEIQDELRR